MKEIKDRNKLLKEIYLTGISCQEIFDSYNFGISVRQMQRVLKIFGVVRTQRESYILAIQNGRMKYYQKPENLKQKRKSLGSGLRYKIVERDGRKLVVASKVKQYLASEIELTKREATQLAVKDIVKQSKIHTELLDDAVKKRKKKD